MNIAFRVDASAPMGTGHFVRCLTLADGLKRHAARIRFVSRHMPEHFRVMLNTKGHEFVPIDNTPSEKAGDAISHSHWLGVSQAQDATDTLHALSDQAWDWLIVDHYALDASWESVLRQAAQKIMVIDDIADRAHDCDMLLDQNLYADTNSRYTGKVPAHCHLLLGPRYALLREEFIGLHDMAKPRDGIVKRILIFFGGVDINNLTSRAIEVLANIGTQDVHVDVVIGAQHPHRGQIESACVDRAFVCHVQTSRMAELISMADLAIGAGGSAIWERCCLGLPTLTICAADNQRRQIADAASEGLLYAPEWKDELAFMLKLHTDALIGNSCLRKNISHNGIRAVDGRGVLRVIRSLGCSAVEVRAARHDDMEKLFVWRNHPAIRAVSRSADIIDWESHQQWFASVMNNPDRVLLIGQDNGLPVGVVRFDIHGDKAEVSIYLVPDAKKSCHGQDLLLSAERWFSANRPEVRELVAHVLGGNEISQRLFLGAFYHIESANYLKRLH
ncbi:MAG: UDP-2,4-diacetamido-2,4,6-trideoxy-beta-L-altropyranose hydrolase [Gallionella sp.]|nr:UDP-2,4-diacetamido-2,4,6-trideoxy-beta-L-altropyranose hydrolase [Gallionella sp.]